MIRLRSIHQRDYRDFINRELPLVARSCESKSVFVSRREAQAALRHGRHGRRGQGGLYAYRCRYHRHWHLGHRRRKSLRRVIGRLRLRDRLLSQTGGTIAA